MRLWRVRCHLQRFQTLEYVNESFKQKGDVRATLRNSQAWKGHLYTSWAIIIYLLSFSCFITWLLLTALASGKSFKNFTIYEYEVSQLSVSSVPIQDIGSTPFMACNMAVCSGGLCFISAFGMCYVGLISCYTNNTQSSVT